MAVAPPPKPARNDDDRSNSRGPPCQPLPSTKLRMEVPSCMFPSEFVMTIRGKRANTNTERRRVEVSFAASSHHHNAAITLVHHTDTVFMPLKHVARVWLLIANQFQSIPAIRTTPLWRHMLKMTTQQLIRSTSSHFEGRANELGLAHVHLCHGQGLTQIRRIWLCPCLLVCLSFSSAPGSRA